MSKDTAELLAAITATATGVMLLIGLGVRYVLLPWLREHLIGPLLGKLETIADRVEGVTRDLSVAANMFEGHITASGEDRGRLWDAITELRAQLPRRRRHKITR